MTATFQMKSVWIAFELIACGYIPFLNYDIHIFIVYLVIEMIAAITIICVIIFRERGTLLIIRACISGIIASMSLILLVWGDDEALAGSLRTSDLICLACSIVHNFTLTMFYIFQVAPGATVTPEPKEISVVSITVKD